MTELLPLATHLEWHQHTGEAATQKDGQRLWPRRDRLRGAHYRRRPQACRYGRGWRSRGAWADSDEGYWERPEETAKAVIDGWMHTGDGGYMDEEGYVYLVDRVKDMIISGGENVYSMEVENVIAQHPAVSQCAVIGIPRRDRPRLRDSKSGAAVNAGEIIAFCKEKIAGYKCPRSVDIRSEAFPLSGAGKVLKRELQRLYREDHAGVEKAKVG